MVKKKIRKFFDSVSIHEKMLDYVGEETEKHESLIWLIAVLSFAVLISAGAILWIKGDTLSP